MSVAEETSLRGQKEQGAPCSLVDRIALTQKSSLIVWICITLLACRNRAATH